MRASGKLLYYGLFSLCFFIFWFLFKVGGILVISRALFSTAIDVVITMGALAVTVEVLLPRLLHQNKRQQFFLFFPGIVLAGGSLIILAQLKLSGSSLFRYQENIARYKEHYFYWFWADLVAGSYFMIFFISATGAAIRLAFDRMKELNRVEALQKEKARSELELLKHQVNPHFLFNALNTIYYKVDRSNGQARDILQRFSNMLRYQLYECDKSSIEVEKELLFVRSYIELQQERLNDNYSVTCSGLEDVKGFVIAPLLLTPLVENCFKHVSRYPDKANIISIACGTADCSFWLATRNTYVKENGARQEDSGGIGLENVRKRLELTYPGRYELAVHAGNDWYEVTLNLQIDEKERLFDNQESF